MAFDRIIENQCNLPEKCDDGGTIPDGSVVTDPDCNDPAFAAANPGLCADTPRLIIKPGSICIGILGTVTFRVFASNNGVEMEVLQELTFTSSNPTVAIIGATGGVATGLTGGIATITVTWHDLMASAQLTVVDEALQIIHVGTALMIDNSRSMSLIFGSPFGTKLDFAKQAAFRYAGELNETKDLEGLYSFNTAALPLSALTGNSTTIKDLITTIPSSTERTNLSDAISDAATYLNDQAVDRRIIVLFTDGENKEGPDPTIVADEFKASGGVIVVMGIRANGDAFKLLQKIATGGFFLNGTMLNASTILDELSGLKGYLCAGNCVPDGDTIVPRAHLNYTGWLNWDSDNDVGPCDLVGGTPPYALFDLLPGNGLYVDLAGSGPPWKGRLVLKFETLAALDPDTYSLQFYLAGNQRENFPGSVAVKAWSDGESEGDALATVITVTDWKQPFTLYTFEVNATTHFRVSFELTDNHTDFYGLLLDRVSLIRVSDNAVMFSDDFDGENPTFIPPACGASELGYVYGSGYGGCYGYGCLSTPPGEVLQDDNPPPDIE